MPQVLDDKAAKLSIMFIADTSGYSSYVSLIAKEAENIARNEIRVGVISFSSDDIPLQQWKNTDSFRTMINTLPHKKSTNMHLAIDSATSELGSEGNRIIVLFSDGEDYYSEAAQNAVNRVKQSGIVIYTVDIGGEMGLVCLASFPPGRYSIAVANFSIIVLDILKMSSSSSYGKCPFCVNKISLQHVLFIIPELVLPPDGLTIKVPVPSGQARVYASYTIRKPSYLTADAMTRGSGNLSLYVPYGGSGTVCISVIAEKPNTTLLPNVETGKVTTTLSKFTVMPILLYIQVDRYISWKFTTTIHTHSQDMCPFCGPDHMINFYFMCM